MHGRVPTIFQPLDASMERTRRENCLFISDKSISSVTVSSILRINRGAYM